MVAGPMDSGKSSLATILSAYAARYVEKSFTIGIHVYECAADLLL